VLTQGNIIVRFWGLILLFCGINGTIENNSRNLLENECIF
jgi:hypothetical protein